MKTLIHLPFRYRILTVFTALLLVTTGSSAQEKQFDRIVVFGSSLSDPGNAFVLLSNPQAYGIDDSCDLGTPANTPPYDKLDDFLIPDGTYARGGHHVSNGATWVEQFARGRGLSGDTRPALGNEGTKASNYAVGGARAAVDYPCRFNLSDQLAAYQQDSLAITDKTLFVIEIGGNDIRDALAGQDPSIIVVALDNIVNAIVALYDNGNGAKKFLLVNVPALGNTPAVKMIADIMPPEANVVEAANALTLGFNVGLEEVRGSLNGLPGIDIRMLDLHALLKEIIITPEDFGITNTEDACITPNVAPFTCKNSDSYLFWDGIHPTKAVHAIMAQRAAEVLND